MKKTRVIIIMISLLICFFSEINTYYIWGEEISESIIDQRNDQLAQEYGITYEDLYLNYIGYLDADKDFYSTIYEALDEVGQGITASDEYTAAFLSVFGSIDTSIKLEYRQALSELGIMDSEYEKEAHAVGESFLYKLSGNEDIVRSRIKSIDKKYKTLRNKEKIAQGILDEESIDLIFSTVGGYLIDDSELFKETCTLFEKNASNIDKIEKRMKKTEYICLILEVYEIKKTILDDFMSYIPQQYELYDILEIYYNHSESWMWEQVKTFLLDDILIDKTLEICKEALKAELGTEIWGAFALVKATSAILREYYENYYASSKEITDYYIYRGFYTAINAGIDNLQLKINNQIINCNTVDRTDIYAFEMLFNARLIALSEFAQAGVDILYNEDTYDKNVCQTCKELCDSYSFNHFIRIWIKAIKGEDITFIDIPITEMKYSVESGDIMYINTLNGKCYFDDSNGTTKKQIINFWNKEMGGIQLNGGKIIVIGQGEARISKLIINGGEIEFTEESKLITDELVIKAPFVYSSGTIESASNVNIHVPSDMGIDMEKLKIETGGNVNITYYASGSISNMEITAYNIIIDNNINTHLVLKDNVIINGNISCGHINVTGNENVFNGNVTLNNSIINGSLKVNGDFTDAGYLYMKNKDGYLNILGDYYAHGISYTKGLNNSDFQLVEGTIEIKGDLYVNEIERKDNTWSGSVYYFPFYANPNFNLILSGKEKHYIYGSPKIGCLTCKDSVIIDSMIQIDSLKSNIHIMGDANNLTIKDLDGYKLEIEGDYIHSGKNIDSINYTNTHFNNDLLKNGEVIVHGKIESTEAIGLCENATIKVDGDFLVHSIYLKENAKIIVEKNAIISDIGMLSNSSEMHVKGDFTCDQKNQYLNGSKIYILDAGMISIGGNIELIASSDTCAFTYNSFVFRLNGKEKQTISTSRPFTVSQFETVNSQAVIEDADIIITNPFSARNIIIESGSLEIKDLVSDITILGKENGKIVIKQGNGHVVEIKGLYDTINLTNCKICSDEELDVINLVINQSVANFESSVICGTDESGGMVVYNSSLKINENLTTYIFDIQASNIEVVNSMEYKGKFSMDSNTCLTVKDLYANGWMRYSSDYQDIRVKNGKIVLYGNIFAKNNYRIGESRYGYYYPFYMRDNTVLELVGSCKHILNIQNGLPNLLMGDNDTLEIISDSDMIIDKLDSNAVVLFDHNITVYNWDNHSMTTLGKAQKIVDNIPSNYVELPVEEGYYYTLNYISKPYLSPYVDGFWNDISLELLCDTPNTKIYYTLDGSKPDIMSNVYTDPFTIKDSTIIRAIAFRDGMKESEELNWTVDKYHNIDTIKINGTCIVGDVLTASVIPNTPDDANYQWFRIDKDVKTPIDNARDSFYKLSRDDIGCQIAVVIEHNGFYVSVATDQLIKDIDKYTIEYDPGIGHGNMDTEELLLGQDLILKECMYDAPEGMRFLGWKIQGRDGIYNPGEILTLDSSLKVIAVWMDKMDPNRLKGVYIYGKEAYGESLYVISNCNSDNIIYEWYRDDAVIPDAVSSIYQLSEEDIGKNIYVVAYQDNVRYTSNIICDIKKGEQEVPERNDLSFYGTKIKGVTTNMEYSLNVNEEWKSVEDDEIELNSGNVCYIRNKETQLFNASIPIEICKKDIMDVRISAMSFIESNINMIVDSTLKLDLILEPTNALNKKLRWCSSNSDIADVDDNGYVYAKAAGMTTISAMAMDGSDIIALCTIVVNPHILAITFDENGHGVAPSSQSIPYGTVLNRPNDLFEENYLFEGWYKDSGCTEAFDFDTIITENITLYAKWVICDRSITMISGQADRNNAKKGEIITVTADTYEGKVFTGWESDFEDVIFEDALQSTTTFVMPAHEVVIRANHEFIQSKLTYTLNGGSMPTGVTNPTEYTYDTATITLNNPVRTGYTFGGWYTDAGFASGTKVTNIPQGSSGDKTFYAKWSKTKYTITYNLNSGKNNSANPASYYVTTDTITLVAPTRTGYTFAGWYSDSAFKTKVTKIAKGSTGNKTLYAKWSPNQYTIKYNGNGSTSGFMTEKTGCKYGTSYTLAANAFKKKGYTFTGWNTKANGTGTVYANKASVKNLSSASGGSVTLYAQWKKTKYTITYKLNGGKNNSSNPASYYVTTSTITLAKPTRTGYTFAGWYSDSSFKMKVTKITKGSTGNKTLYAKWSPNKYTIKFNGNGATSGTMKNQTGCKYGTSYTLSANAYKKTGYTFAGWNTKKDGSGTTYKNKASVKNLTGKNGGTVTLYAQWKKK